jgi:hypothetical protein
MNYVTLICADADADADTMVLPIKFVILMMWGWVYAAIILCVVTICSVQCDVYHWALCGVL